MSVGLAGCRYLVALGVLYRRREAALGEQQLAMAHELMPAAACASASSLRAAGMVMVSEPSMRRDLLSDRARPPNAAAERN